MDNILSDMSFSLDDFNPISIAKQISQRVKARRLELNLTQQELAAKSGVSLGSIKRFETSYEISLKSLLMLALVLNATDSFSDLFSQTQYQSINQIIGTSRKRQRARKK